uniref:Yippee like 5 n=1 Tax=Astyanax mexicanus TaxID=7994 RepID=A0A3B1JI26_ASTMX
MGRIFLDHIGGTRLFSCANCDTILTNRSELISTRFTGATGRAFLFNKVVNLQYSEVQDRVMLDGRQTWCETLAVRTATVSWAGSTSLPQRTASATKRDGSSWRGRWCERVRALRSTSRQMLLESRIQSSSLSSRVDLLHYLLFTMVYRGFVVMFNIYAQVTFSMCVFVCVCVFAGLHLCPLVPSYAKNIRA